MRALRGWIFVCSLATAAWAEAHGGGGDDCAAMADCGSCLRTPGCRWCAAGVDTNNSRCEHEMTIKDTTTWCNGFQWGPKSNYSILDNRTTNSELYPQHARLQLRVGETKTINITYKRLEDYPIDLYYLLDFSDTMKTRIKEISRLEKNLTTAMRKVTKNFHLGFGSFLDKVLMPFVFIDKIESSCSDSGCDVPYSFKNHFPLNNDTKLFSQKINGISDKMLINNDLPEGGLDALMQAIVCTNETKWRNGAHHFLILVTDGLYHIAGDGKLAGVVEPNPGICMLDANNEYYGYKEYDYPTISQINRKANEKKINIIFAVTNTYAQDYKALSEKIQSSSVQILSHDSTQTINLIVEAYNEFEKSVQLMDDAAASKGIGVIYYSHCSGSGDPIKTNKCNNITATSPVYFQAHITAITCPPDVKDSWHTTINISPLGVQATLQLDVEVFCSCPCEFEGHKFYVKSSPLCHSRGTSICGVCEYDDMSFGETCQYDRNEGSSMGDEKLLGCTSNGTICSDHGTCNCGKCLCNSRQNPGEMFYGKYCQCDNFSCKRHDGLLCSGKGQCQCGHCECDAGWTEAACECPEMQTGCVAPGENQVCSGLGKCVCGKCECEEQRSGKYCGDCMQTLNVTCPGGRCNEFAACVKCLVHEESSCSSCALRGLKIVEEINENSLAAKERFCKVPMDGGCSFVFTYLEETDQVIIRALKTKECPSPINLIGIVCGISGAILFLVLIGILLWKLCTTIHDRREYARYAEELENTKWAALDNPLHQNPTTTTMNPTYNSRRRSRFSFMLR